MAADPAWIWCSIATRSHGPGSLSAPDFWNPAKFGNCLMMRMTPIAANNPLMTLVGMNLASIPKRARPKPIWMIPAKTTTRRNASKDPTA